MRFNTYIFRKIFLVTLFLLSFLFFAPTTLSKKTELFFNNDKERHVENNNNVEGVHPLANNCYIILFFLVVALIFLGFISLGLRRKGNNKDLFNFLESEKEFFQRLEKKVLKEIKCADESYKILSNNAKTSNLIVLNDEILKKADVYKTYISYEKKGNSGLIFFCECKEINDVLSSEECLYSLRLNNFKEFFSIVFLSIRYYVEGIVEDITKKYSINDIINELCYDKPYNDKKVLKVYDVNNLFMIKDFFREHFFYVDFIERNETRDFLKIIGGFFKEFLKDYLEKKASVSLTYNSDDIMLNKENNASIYSFRSIEKGDEMPFLGKKESELDFYF